jgi:3-methyladenine DNA glycosylase/8-oxoguanine DNA glycosylase
VRFHLAAGRDFDFSSAVCSHGYFMLAPNYWLPDRQTLRTAFALDDTQAVVCELSQAPENRLLVGVPGLPSLSSAWQTVITHAVRRMLRLNEDLAPFHRQCCRIPTHRDAAREKFGRLLRSATLFEDVVKTICTTNITWRQTVAIVAALTARYGLPALNDPAAHAFPSPQHLARASLAALRSRCRLGYRARFIREFAIRVAEETFDLAVLEDPDLPGDELYRRLRTIKGVGDYCAANLCMLLGRYDRLAVDTELKRHFKELYPESAPTLDDLRRHYAAHHPYEFLAYWYELWTGYARRHGPPCEWSPEHVAARITR